MSTAKSLSPGNAMLVVTHLLKHGGDWPVPLAGHLVALADCIAKSEDGAITRRTLLDQVFGGISSTTANNRVSEIRKRLLATDEKTLGYRLGLESSEHKGPDTQRFRFRFEGKLPLEVNDATARAAASVQSSRSVSTCASSDLLEIMVSYAAADGAPWGELKSLLEQRLRARSDPRARAVRFWTFHDIPGGDNDHETMQAAIDRCAVGLLLVSPNACASDYIQDREWPRFRNIRGQTLKPFVAIHFDRIDTARHRLGVLNSIDDNRTQLMHLRQSGANALDGEEDFTWLECTTTAKKKEFVEILIDHLIRKLPPLDRQQEPTTDATYKGSVHASPDRKVAEESKHTDAQAAESAEKNRTSGVRPVQMQLMEWALERNPDTPPFGVIVGDFGTGKTWNSQLFAQRLMAEPKTGEVAVPLPIYFDLFSALGSSSPLVRGDTVPKLEMILDTLIEQCAAAGETRQRASEVIALVREQGALVIFDGLDELLTHKPEDWGVNFIRTLLEILPRTYWPRGFNPGATSVAGSGKVLLTCRTHYFKSLEAQQQALRAQEKTGHRGAETRSWELKLFDDGLICDYISRNAPELNPATTLADFKRVHDLYDIARRPIGLKNLLALLGGRPMAAQFEGEQRFNAAAVYDRMVAAWLERDKGKHLLLPEDKEPLLQDLALYLWRRGERRIAWNALQEWFRDWLPVRPSRDNAYKPATGQSHAQYMSVLLEDLRTATLLTRAGEHDFAFAHTAMQEYFVARRLYRALVQPNEGLQWPINLSTETLDFIAQCHEIEGSPHDRSQASATLAQALQREGDSPFKRTSVRLYSHAPTSWPEVSSINLNHMHLDGFVLRDARLASLSARGTQLRRSRWRDNQIDDLDFTDAQLCGSQLIHLSGRRFEAERMDARFSHWHDLSYSRISWDKALWDNARLGRLPNHPTQAVLPRGELLRSLAPSWVRRGPMQAVAAVVLNSELFTLTATDDTTVRLWNGRGECLATFASHSRRVVDCALASHNGELFALTALNDQTARLWDARGKCLATYSEHSAGIHGCALVSHSGELFALTASADRTAQLWDARGKKLFTFSGHSNDIRDCALASHDGELFALTASTDGTARLWNKRGNCLVTFSNLSIAILGCALASHSGEIFALTASADGTARLWNTGGECLRTFSSHAQVIRGCSLASHAGQLFALTAWNDRTARLWNSQGECLATLTGHSDEIRGCVLASVADDLFALTASTDQTARLWNAQGDCLATFSGHFAGVRGSALASHADDIFALTTSADQIGRLWNGRGECLATLLGHSDEVRGCALASHAGELFALTASADGTARLWNARGENLATFSGHSAGVLSCALASHGDEIFALTSSADGTARLWNARAECIATFPSSSSWIGGCALVSHDGELFALTPSTNETAQLWNARGESLATFSGHSAGVLGCALASHGGEIFALTSSADRTARLWNVQGHCVAVFSGHSDWILSCALVSHDGKLFAFTASEDKTARLWNSSGECLSTFSGHLATILGCSLASKAAEIFALTASADGCAFLWQSSGKNSGPMLRSWYLHGPGIGLDFAEPDWVGRDRTDALWPYVNWVDSRSNPPQGYSIDVIEAADAPTRELLRDGFGHATSWPATVSQD